MPGDMGHAVGRVLREHGHRVVTCLSGRSERTRGLAGAAGLEDAPDLNALVGEADMVLSIVPPGRALAQAEAVAVAMKETGSTPVYVDCNAISPGLTKIVGDAIAGASAPYIDAGIIGLAPGKGPSTRFYVSGPGTGPMLALDGKGIEVIPLGEEIGAASGLKMCYAGLTKGKWSLYTAVLLAAERMGLSEALKEEFEFSQQADLMAMRERVPRLPADSGRWIAEMENIAGTFAAAGVPSGFHEGAEEIFRILAKTPFASETRETIDASRTLEESIKVYAEYLPGQEERK
jgi:3-hydroxyisobutyrate dehydrogenase-like beta-hydroxyacid dehydrogenase